MKKFIALVTLLLMSGCGTVQMVDFDLQMISFQPFQTKYDGKLYSLIFDYNLPAKGNEFGTNFRVPLLWKDLTSSALNQSQVFREDSTRQIEVLVTVNYAELPSVGFRDMYTSLEATYSIIDRSSGEALYSSEVRSHSSIPLSHAFSGVTRAKESVTRAVTKNVEDFLEQLREHIESKRHEDVL